MYFLCNRKRETTSNNIKVAKSISLSKPNGALVQLVRIHACHAWGHGFESRTHRKQILNQIFGSVAQLNRASDYGSEGYRFESCRSHEGFRNQIAEPFFYVSCLELGIF